MKTLRIVLFVAMILLIGYAAIFGVEITISGPGPTALPKFVQSMTPENYEAWASWQNAASAAHKKTTWEDPYIQGAGRVTTVNTGMIGPRGRRGGDANASFSGLTISESFPTSFVNNHYTGPGALTVFNPYCKFTENTGAPNWAELYVITDIGVMSMSKAMARYAPMPPEELFQRLMAPHFKAQ
jgi:hypothetical protein